MWAVSAKKKKSCNVEEDLIILWRRRNVGQLTMSDRVLTLSPPLNQSLAILGCKCHRFRKTARWECLHRGVLIGENPRVLVVLLFTVQKSTVELNLLAKMGWALGQAVRPKGGGLAWQLMVQSRSAWGEISLPCRVNTDPLGPDRLKLEIRCYCRSWETVRCPNSCLTKELDRRTMNSYLNYGKGAVMYLITLFSFQ